MKGHFPVPFRRAVFTAIHTVVGMAVLGGATASAEMGWRFNSAPSAYKDDLTESMDLMVAMWNAYARYDYKIGAIYASGTPTADAGYLGQIRFGGQRNFRTAMHESCHWMGTGSVGQWEGFYRERRWTGTYAYNLKCAYDGPGERQSGDRMHFWPYGANQDSEGVNGPRMVGLVGAYRRDMGLEQGDRTIGIASGIYRLRNRETITMLDSMGATMERGVLKQKQDSPGTNQQWQVSLIPGTVYFTIQNVASGKYLDTLGRPTEGMPIAMTSLVRSAPVESQLWEIVATDSFFFRIVNKASGKALDNLGLATEGAPVVQSSASGAKAGRTQEWRFVHPLVQAVPEAGVISQGRPATASSSETGNDAWKANNGVAEDRWTAAADTYPQWWRVDLGAVQPITKVAVDWYEARAYQYKIETSEDDVNYKTVVDRSNSRSKGPGIEKLTEKARYVRVTVLGGPGYAGILECRVYNEASPARLLSQFRPTKASSEQQGNLACNATDVDAYFTRWAADKPEFPQWWQVDLGAPQKLSHAVIEWFGKGERSYQYKIEGSLNGTSFTNLADQTKNTSQDTSADKLTGVARYVRVTVTGSTTGYAGFYDVQIYGVPGPQAVVVPKIR